MFKRLQKSVIDKNSLLSLSLTKRTINKTPRKIILPNRSNLTFSNIIVNMNANPRIGNNDSWNNSYFNTELYNNLFYIKSSNSSITNISRNIDEVKDDHSKILLKIINGILCLKSNDLLSYSINLIEIITYVRDSNEKYDYMKINSEKNNNLLKLLYQIYLKIFPENSFICLILKDDLKNGMKIFKKIHSLYLFYILSGLSFINVSKKEKNLKFFNFLKQFIKKEKCFYLNCPICSHIRNYIKDISNNIKPSVIKILVRKGKKSKDNNKIKFDLKIKKNLMNINNSNIINKRSFNNDSIERNYYSNIVNKSSRDLNANSVNRVKNDLFEIKKSMLYNQSIKCNKRKKDLFYNHNSTKNENKFIKKMNINKIKEKLERKNNNINPLETIEAKQYTIEKKENNDKNTKKIGRKISDTIKSKIIKNPVRKSNNKLKNLNMNTYSEKDNIIDNKNNNTIQNTERNIIKLTKSKKIKINLLSTPNNKIKNKHFIISDDSESKKNRNDNEEDSLCIKSNFVLHKSSKFIKESINQIEKELMAFKIHNVYIKQQLEKILNKDKKKGYL